MLDKLLRLYESQSTSAGSKSVFAETLLFNEGWLLVGVLDLWQRWNRPSRFPFLPFAAGSKVRSPVQLYVPFKKMKRVDDYGETNTRADGLVGHFNHDASKSGVRLFSSTSFLVAFEAKMSSGFSPIKNHRYSQVSRTVACMIHAAIEAKVAQSANLHFVVLYPQGNRKIDPAKHTRDNIASDIEARVAHYRNDGRSLPAFESAWRQIWDRMIVTWATWEDVVDEMNNMHLTEYYQLCKRFN